MQTDTTSQYPEIVRCTFYLGTHHIEYLDRIARRQATPRADVMRRILDESMARQRVPAYVER